MITIKFVKNSIVENNEYQIPKTIIQKYPNSIFNFCTDFDIDSIELDSDNITYTEFKEVIDVINDIKNYSQIPNKRIRTFLKKNGLIHDVFEVYSAIQKNRSNKEMLEFHAFIHGDVRYYAPKDIEFYHAVKHTLLKNDHILSMQTFFNDNVMVININEMIPIFFSNAFLIQESILKCANNEINILQARYDILWNHAMYDKLWNHNRYDKFVSNLFSNDNAEYLATCVFLSCNFFFFTRKKSSIISKR